MKTSRKSSDRILIFRRFRKTKDGMILDSYKYGLKAWPLWIKSDKL
jgi:hypothetical protein